MIRAVQQSADAIRILCRYAHCEMCIRALGLVASELGFYRKDGKLAIDEANKKDIRDGAREPH